ncbi:InlB B-repeat-containing protein [Chloroflexota bacterium]
MKTNLTRKGMLAGGCGLLLAITLIASLASPVLAVPGTPHQFYGSVKVNGEIAEPGTVVTAIIGGMEYPSSTTTVDTDGHYGYQPTFKLPADDRQTPQKEGGVNGDIVEFYIQDMVAGQAIFSTFGLTLLNLQAPNEGETTKEEPLTKYSLTLKSAAGGSVTAPGEGMFTYDSGDVVNLQAAPTTGFGFVNWTGDVSTVANVYAAKTTVTVNEEMTITANFAVRRARLTVTSTEGGSVANPGEGVFTRVEGSVVNLKALAQPGYEFVGWTGDVDTMGDVNGADTTVTMHSNHSLTANFAPTSSENPAPSGVRIIALLVIPESENIEAALASLSTGNPFAEGGDTQTYYIYIPGDPSGEGHWVKVTLP